MNLSTFNFSRKNFLAPLLLSVAVIALLQVSCERVLRFAPPYDFLVSYRDGLVKADAPSSDYYLSYDRGSIDHHVLYHDIWGAAEYLKKADILVLGNSRTQAALLHDEASEFFSQLGLRYFNMSFGHTEHSVFPRKLIEKYDLHPKLVLINTDGFFQPQLSDVAEEVLRQDKFSGLKAVYEKVVSFELRKLIHRFYPIYSKAAHSEWLVYRSMKHGGWVVNTISPTIEKLEFEEDKQKIDLSVLPYARTILRELQERGAKVVLTTIPAPNANMLLGPALAKELDLEFIALDTLTLETIDGSHVSEKSAKVVSDAILKALAQSVLSLDLS